MIVLIVLVVLGVPGGSASGEPGAPASLRPLMERLRRAGRAEARLSVTTDGGAAGRTRRGTLSLEPPDRVRLDFGADGERIALRRDGGEWIQPAAKQMIVLAPRHVEAAVGLWSLFLSPERAPYEERRVAPGRFRLTRRAVDSTLPDSVTITVDGNGLPRGLEIVDEAGTRLSYRLGDWRFLKPQGPGAFMLPPPRDFEVVEMP